MWKYLIKRLISIVPILIGATFIVFTIMSLAPSDAVEMLLPDASEEEQDQLREELGLNDPLLIQYGNYILNLFKGDLGISYRTKAPVTKELISRVPYTLRLATIAFALSIIIAIPLGTFAAIKQNTLFDTISMTLCLLGISMPTFWTALLFILFFSVKLNVLPVSGADSFAHLILPALTMCISGLAAIGRITRSSMLEVVRQDYIRTARAKGLPERTVIVHHALKNAMIPTITAAGLRFGVLLCGSVVTETIFAWPGIGRFLVSSITWRDTPSVLGCVTFFVIAVSLINLAVDILYGFIDPRIKAKYKK